jgi:predicted RNA-binding protein with PUA-like domain
MINYWLIKGNPGYYDWDKDLRPGHVERWSTSFHEDAMAKGDRVFLWESGGRSRIIGFAVVVANDGLKNREWRFRVKYLSERFDYMPRIAELRSAPAICDASFLKRGVFRTVYPLTGKQAAAMYSAVISANPADDIWRDVSKVSRLPDIDLNLSAKEGRRKLVTHLQIERAPNLAPAKKAQFRSKHDGDLFCECCGRNYVEYGKHHEAMFEVHHLKALGKVKMRTITKLSDLAVICSNCHRVIHRNNPMISVVQLSRQLRCFNKA